MAIMMRGYGLLAPWIRHHVKVLPSDLEHAIAQPHLLTSSIYRDSHVWGDILVPHNHILESVTSNFMIRLKSC